MINKWLFFSIIARNYVAKTIKMQNVWLALNKQNVKKSLLLIFSVKKYPFGNKHQYSLKKKTRNIQSTFQQNKNFVSIETVQLL